MRVNSVALICLWLISIVNSQRMANYYTRINNIDIRNINDPSVKVVQLQSNDESKCLIECSSIYTCLCGIYMKNGNDNSTCVLFEKTLNTSSANLSSNATLFVKRCKLN